MPPKVALVHDYLIQDGGGERVLAALQELFPSAPTFTLFYDPARAHACFAQKDIRTSGLQRVPFLRRREEWTLPFMPMAIEHMDFSGFDLVISSCSTFTKGIIVPPGTTHICYLHTPTRFLWEDRTSYVNDLALPRLVKRLLPYTLHRLRTWDRLAADRPDALITNSMTSQERIRRYYHRDAVLVRPPVDSVAMHTPSANIAPPTERPFWLTGGRLVGYKRFDLTVQAFAKLNLPLKIFGTGPELKRLRKRAGANTVFLGRISDEEKQRLYQQAIGFIHPQVEDFGITAVEAMTAGKPVIAYKKGGGAETVIHGVTGELIDMQTWEDIGDAIIRFNASRYNAETIRAHASQFSKEQFQAQFRALLHRYVPSTV